MLATYQLMLLSISVRRNKCSRKSPDLSGCDNLDSSAFVSMEDNGSEILTIDRFKF